MPKPQFIISKRELARRIYLSGQKHTGYRVHSGRIDGLDDIDTASAIVGFAIVRALREVAARRPDLLPGSRPATKPRRSRARSADA